MFWLLLGLVAVIVIVVSSRRAESPSTLAAPHPSRADIEGQILREIDAEAAQLLQKIDDQVEVLPDDGPTGATSIQPDLVDTSARGPGGKPSWMSAEDWDHRLVRYRKQGRSSEDIARMAANLERLGPWQPRTREELIARSVEIGIVTRAVYVPKEDEAPHLTRDDDGLPTLRLVDAGDRLAIWSPIDGGELINPKGPGLRSLGLYSSYVRGSDHRRSAYRSADLRKGQWIELKREPDNPHDKNAVAMCAANSSVPIGYVQRGRAAAVARRIDAGEDLAGVSMRGPKRGCDDDTTHVLIGSKADLRAMLDDV